MNVPRIKSALGFYAQRLLPGALGIVLLPWLFEVSGPAIYQSYSISLLLGGAISMLCGSWLAQSGMRNLQHGGYDRESLKLLCRLLAGSALVAAMVCAGLLFLGLAQPGLSPIPLCLATALMTAQATTMPVVQAVGRHVSCLISELIRTAGTVVLLGLLHRSTGLDAETALAIGTAASMIALLPALRSVAAEATRDRTPMLPHARAMLRYGAPLSAYNGLSLWLQYTARATLVAFSGSTTAGGRLVIVSDLCQKVVSSFSAPLVASQMPAMIMDFNAGDSDKVERRSRMLQRMVVAAGVLLLFATMVCFALKLWIFDSRQVVVGAIVAVTANSLMQLSVCAQKQMELRGANGRLAAAMSAAALASAATAHYAPPALHAAIPGLSLLCGASTLYVLVYAMVARDARSSPREGLA